MPAYISKKGDAAGSMYGFIYDGVYKYEDFNTSVDANGKTIYKLKDDVVRISDDAQPGDPKYKIKKAIKSLMTIAPLLVTDSPSIQVVSAITLSTRTGILISSCNGATATIF